MQMHFTLLHEMFAGMMTFYTAHTAASLEIQ